MFLQYSVLYVASETKYCDASKYSYDFFAFFTLFDEGAFDGFVDGTSEFVGDNVGGYVVVGENVGTNVVEGENVSVGANVSVGLTLGLALGRTLGLALVRAVFLAFLEALRTR